MGQTPTAATAAQGATWLAAVQPEWHDTYLDALGYMVDPSAYDSLFIADHPAYDVARVELWKAINAFLSSRGWPLKPYPSRNRKRSALGRRARKQREGDRNGSELAPTGGVAEAAAAEESKEHKAPAAERDDAAGRSAAAATTAEPPASREAGLRRRKGDYG
mmetsp:Transcript_4916/g.17828  ORF Transcript_4916/g.17828 Transcript_4916/m.17828 type:complete len:162 (-) Transcript_4916:183-668(-)|eukprot:CAMPEP_0203818952 /NCGR_PEP_ID=MMETSP0115-20131106/33438_1 /ASSEMBLY_ACC=CAM_ASM_000227 /TAXON_ID=33651 /ORGANISM="Bicosoecid sp, Strain ms1" /LENGTH=161 /DNA_ID=CAMNT_0050727925 /DNA_START=195 /DNA_END=680 /DNA_ORIENTATION=+